MMKVRSELHINFRDHSAMYQALKRDSKLKINLNYQLKSLVFGKHKDHHKIFRYLHKYKNSVSRSELNPAILEKKHLNGNFVVKHNLHVFPVEFKSDFSNTKVDSYQYSMVKKFKPISRGSLETPDITFQVEFVPLVRVWHLKQMSKKKLIINLLGVCGGVYSMVGIVNWFMSTGVKALASL